MMGSRNLTDQCKILKKINLSNDPHKSIAALDDSDEGVETYREGDVSSELYCVSEKDSLINDTSSRSFNPLYEAIINSKLLVDDTNISQFEIYVSSIEKKIDFLTDTLLEQGKLLASIHTAMRNSSEQVLQVLISKSRIAEDLMKIALFDRVIKGEASSKSLGKDAAGSAIAQTQQRFCSIKEKLGKDQEAMLNYTYHIIQAGLENLLSSEALKDSIVKAVADSTGKVIESCLQKILTASYLPLIETSHRRVVRQFGRSLSECFHELNANVKTATSRASVEASRSLRTALKRHERVLRTFSDTKHDDIIGDLDVTIQSTLEKQLALWKGQLTSELKINGIATTETPPPPQSCPQFTPNSPPQPVESTLSVDLLMQMAKIQSLLNNDDLNGVFQLSLSASDLSLLMAACREIDPSKAFTSPCLIKQNVLLSLIQQLAVDMAHDTQLKCRFLEGAILCLDVKDTSTRLHLPFIARELKINLSMFIEKYPSHMLKRRIQLLIMAVQSLIM